MRVFGDFLHAEKVTPQSDRHGESADGFITNTSSGSLREPPSHQGEGFGVCLHVPISFPVIYRVNHTGDTSDHRKQHRPAEAVAKRRTGEETEYARKHHNDYRHDRSEFLHMYPPPDFDQNNFARIISSVHSKFNSPLLWLCKFNYVSYNTSTWLRK